MDEIVLSQMIRIEDRHWWYLARREIVGAMIIHTKLSNAEILDMGCGGGGNIPMLMRFGRVRGVEMDPEARAAAESRRTCEVADGYLPDHIPYGTDRFDLVALLDVLEHVPEDGASVRRLLERLNPGGRVVVTVPAYMFLWRKQDDLNRHQRRYTLRQLEAVFRDNGFCVEHATYYNVMLFPLMAGIILGNKLLGREQADDNRIPSAPVNWALWKILAFERWLVPRFRFPFGASVLLVARKQ